MSLNGSAVLLSMNTGTDEAPEFTVIPCQTTGDYDLSVETRDTSCKDSADEQVEPGSRSRSISVEILPNAWPELVESPSTANEKLRHAAETGLKITGRIVVSGVAKEEFDAVITSFSLSAGREESVTNSIELQVSGGMRPVDES